MANFNHDLPNEMVFALLQLLPSLARWFGFRHARLVYLRDAGRNQTELVPANLTPWILRKTRSSGRQARSNLAGGIVPACRWWNDTMIFVEVAP